MLTFGCMCMQWKVHAVSARKYTVHNQLATLFCVCRNICLTEQTDCRHSCRREVDSRCGGWHHRVIGLWAPPTSLPSSVVVGDTDNFISIWYRVVYALVSVVSSTEWVLCNRRLAILSLSLFITKLGWELIIWTLQTRNTAPTATCSYNTAANKIDGCMIWLDNRALPR